ncbi:MAG: RNA pseudouridine synthase [Firmicutes bacterium HGW-Firmicutes-7]|nr:MAG: RNA pseudouridine synthase [Firmicutes bacterium HGW-Firmicutes-7]
MTTKMNLSVLFEDQHIIVVNKPPGVPSQKDRSGDENMASLVDEHLQKRNMNGKKVYVGLIHRLDRPVGGIMVFAKTQFANARLSEQIRLNKMNKEYLVVVCGNPIKETERLTHFLLKQTNNLSRVVSENTPLAKKAILEYSLIESKTVERWGDISLLKVKLITGRHHQIRVQMSFVGNPIWGDTKYNELFNLMESKEWFPIALFAHLLSFEHPKTGKLMTFTLDTNEYPFNQFN